MQNNFKKILFLPVFLSLFISCGKTDAPQAGPQRRPTMVEAFIIHPTQLDNKINVSGSLIANEEVELRSEISGRVTGIFFNEGSKVEKGKLLVKINDDELRAQLTKLELNEKVAADDEFRKRKLLEINGVSKEEYDLSVNRLQSVQADMKIVKSQLRKTEIYAPFDGSIGIRYISPGGYVSPATLVASIQQVHPIKIEFNVPERYKDQLKSGQGIQFSVEGQSRIFTGSVYAIEPKIDPATRTVKVRATSPNTTYQLTPGAFARVELTLEKIADAMIVPTESVIPTIDGQQVFKKVNGRAKVVKILTGTRTDRNIQVLDGLSFGDTVITTGILQVRDGMPLTISQIIN